MTRDDIPATHGEQPPSPEPIMRMIQGLQATAILKTGVELGIFDRISEGASDVSSVAAAIGASERGTRILLDGLAAYGLLETADGAYRLSPLAGRVPRLGPSRVPGGLDTDHGVRLGVALLGRSARGRASRRHRARRPRGDARPRVLGDLRAGEHGARQTRVESARGAARAVGARTGRDRRAGRRVRQQAFTP